MEKQQVIEARLRKAQEIYRGVAKDLEARFRGKIVAIDIESGKYFIGADELEAYDKGAKVLPDTRFVFLRIGEPYVHFIG